MIEASNHRFNKRLAERRHQVLPLLFFNDGEPFDVGEMLNVELEFLPCYADIPGVEIHHVDQYTQRAVLPDESLGLGPTVPII